MVILPVIDGRASTRDLGRLWGVTYVSNLLGYAAFAGLIAGWLMGLATWLSAASRDTVGRILFVLIVTGSIGFGPFHHVILGTTEVLSAMFLGQGVGVVDLGRFLLWTTVGSVVGGSVFVGLLNHGHVALAGEEQDVAFQTDVGGE